jgi:hypothetical protein
MMWSWYVRVPRVVTFTFGAVCGGIAVYLSDAANGEQRRRSALRDVVRLFGRAGRRAGLGALGVLNEFGTVARDTFHAQRAEHKSALAQRPSTAVSGPFS